MEVGIFSRVFSRASIEECFAAVTPHGIRHVQFNFTSAGLASLPPSAEPAQLERIRAAAQSSSLNIAAVSGTSNLVHPDPRARAEAIAGLLRVVSWAPALGAGLVTICTGTKDAGSMWVGHPDNAGTGAWRDLQQSLAQVLPTAASTGVTLLMEPEPGNVVSSAQAARRLLDELGSPHLKVLMDAANLVDPSRPADATRTLETAFETVGHDVALAHAKDITATGTFGPAGTGIVDYPGYIALLSAAGYRGPLVIHEVTEAAVGAAADYLRALLPVAA